jgi:Lrp/AsnC family transcriptional regulator, leucine-responsive regulatory protein
MMKIDELGLGIIELLHANARATNKDIADTLAVSEATVAARIRDMESRNIMRIIMQRDLRALGYDLLVLVDIHVSQRSAEEVAAELAQIEEAASVVVLLSDPDIILQLNVRDRKHLLATIEQKVAPIRGISHWTADIALEIVKLDSRYGTLDAIS